jgi:cell division septation protein DedD
VSSGNQARAALQKFFPQRFTDLQWEMVAAQGYEQAIVSGERTAESVATEIQALMAAVRAEPADGEPSGLGTLSLEPRTWENMEKWVMARAMNAGGTGRERPAPAEAVIGIGDYATGFPEPPSHRWWLWAAFGVVVVAVIVALLFMFVLGGEPTSSTTTSPSSVADMAGVHATVATTEPPATTTSSTTTSTTIPTTTTEVDLTPTYVARLSGAETVPAVSTSATGTLTLTVAEDGLSVGYVFEVSSLTDLTIARLRSGVAGAVGDEIFTIYPGPTIAGAFSGVVAEGSFTAAQLLGPLAGKTIADLEVLMEGGSVYLNVGTIANTGGEIRGQLE